MSAGRWFSIPTPRQTCEPPVSNCHGDGVINPREDRAGGPLASPLNHELVTRLRYALPRIRDWISRYVESTAKDAVTVASLAIPHLARCFPTGHLESTRVLIVDAICYPPLEKFRLGEFKTFTEIPWSGITYDDIYFLRRDAACPALHFHELVHVVQYQRLGVERFLWAYSLDLLLRGYKASLLEMMAYDLQLEFEHAIYRRSLVEDIERRTDVIWQQTCSQPESAWSP